MIIHQLDIHVLAEQPKLYELILGDYDAVVIDDGNRQFNIQTIQSKELKRNLNEYFNYNVKVDFSKDKVKRGIGTNTLGYLIIVILFESILLMSLYPEDRECGSFRRILIVNVKTKLIMPALRKNYIKRKNLLEKLNDIADYKVTLIKGIAGSGKTTAFSIYVSENNLQNVNWISLDKENDEIYSFWYYFCESIKEFLSNYKVFDSFKELLTKDSIYNLIGYIVNELSKDDDIFIVLDDFYHIKDKLLNSTIEYLITYSSSNVHYILITRDNPILCLGQLRAKGQLLEIDQKI